MDLEPLLKSGGSILLTLNKGNKLPAGTDGNPVLVHADVVDFVADAAGVVTGTSSLSAAAAAALKHRLIISEVMWGRDRSDTAAAMAGAQWIEIYNHGAALTAADVLRLHLSQTRSAKNAGEVMRIQTAGDTTPADPADDTFENVCHC